jgi:uncharacterized repeat protein (TIGR03837 family)
VTSTARWDIFCKVIDNYGDVGVCWRLAADLAARAQKVRLWCDDVSALTWLAPQGAPGVEVFCWTDAPTTAVPGDVVVEAFGCDPPPDFVQRMANGACPPVWINLEYLSAEPWVDRSHGLPSPQSAGPGAGLMKWFFYPGFTGATGGLLREAGLLERQAAFDRVSWLQSRGLTLQSGERLVVLFCYENTALANLLQMLGDKPTLLALTPGPAQAQVHQLRLPQRVRSIDLPWLSQTDFDHLLWSADLNLVRGEDSLVRALWAGRPFLWQLYPQADGAHQVKSAAFLDKLLGGRAEQAFAQGSWARDLQRLWRLWNGEQPPAPMAGTDGDKSLAWPEPEAWTRAVLTMRATLLRQPDLSSQLLQFAASHARTRAQPQVPSS